jgi:cobalt-zinc-cadmium efflux system membrane fusion protein
LTQFNNKKQMEQNMQILHKQGAILIRVFTLIIMITVPSCSEDDASEEVQQHEKHGEANGDEDAAESGQDEEQVVRLSEDQLKEFGIELGVAGPADLRVERKLSGEIVIEPDRLAHIIPRFPGMVKEVHKHIGDHVNKGEILAIIESNESLAPYEVKSLIAGTVTDKHLSLGEVITDDSHAFIITDLSSVWANLSVYQKDLPHIKIGQEVFISAGPDGPETKGKISYISPLLEEKTRTATARVVLQNPDGLWRPGLFVSGEVAISSESAAIVIPKTAIETIDGEEVVFVRTEAGFEPRPVSPGRGSRSSVEIIAGLSAGQSIVTKGAFTLKAELAKGSFQSGHSH